MIGIRRLSKNSVLLFTVSRYVGYGLQFVRGILVAKLLGPYLFGIWGFLTLAQQYLSYTGLGLQYAVNVELATGSITDSAEQKEIIGVALTSTTLIACLLGLLGVGIGTLDFTLFDKYSFSQYAPILGVIAGLFHLQQLLTNIYRVYGKLTKIMIGELLSAAVLLLVVLVVRGEALIWVQLGAVALTLLAGIAIFMTNPPFGIYFSLDIRCLKRLLSIGIPLLIYNMSFYLIAVAGRTVISVFYDVETMGYYSLANSITTATLLGLNAVAWVVFPDILSSTRKGLPDETVIRMVKRVNDLYGTSVFLVVFGMILVLPLLFSWLPQYQLTEGVLGVLLLSQAILSISFGYSCVAIARKKQLAVAGVSLIALVVVIGLGLVAAILKFDFVWIAVAVFLGTVVFVVLQARVGTRLLHRGRLQTGYFTSILPWGSLIATLFYFIGSMTGYRSFGVIGMFIFVLSNLRLLEQVWRFAFQKSRVT